MLELSTDHQPGRGDERVRDKLGSSGSSSCYGNISIQTHFENGRLLEPGFCLNAHVTQDLRSCAIRLDKIELIYLAQRSKSWSFLYVSESGIRRRHRDWSD